jgi:hypothetical protein
MTRMRIAASTSRTPLAHGNAAVAVDAEQTPGSGRWRTGRAYRAGRLVCGCVHVTVSLDERLGLTARERRMVRVRFHEPVDDDLRTDLTELARRRGRASERAADRIDPIEVVVDDPGGEQKRMIGGLPPPQRRHGQLREIEFGLHELNWTR